MRPWLLMLGGMVVWAIHFAGIYGIASAFDVISSADALESRWATGFLTLACLAANAVLVFVMLGRRRKVAADPVVAWAYSVGGLLAALSFVSVAWQGLPGLLA